MGLRFRTLHKLQRSLWFAPLVCVAAGLALSLGSVAIDHLFDGKLVPRALTGGPDAALEILGTVASSMINLTALVLTVTMVVVQLAMGQFSPRIVATILRDKPSQLAIGTFVAAFAHSILTMSQVRKEPDSEFVPGLAVVIAFVLVVVSIMVLVLYVNHVGLSLRVASLIENVGSRARRLLDEMEPRAGEVAAAPADVIVAPRSGVLCHVEHEPLVEAARRAGVTLEIYPAVGEFVPAGAPLVRVDGALTAAVRAAATKHITLDKERLFGQDLAYALRLMVDIAVRSLAEPFDPTTAVQAIDRLHDCVRQLAGRDLPDGLHRDRAGEVRLVMKAASWDGYVRLAFEEIRGRASQSVQVTRRLRACLEDLISVAPADRRPALQRQLELLDSDLEHGELAGDSATWREGDPQGLGAPDGRGA